MKISKFSHHINYEDNIFQHTELLIYTNDKVYRLKGIHTLVYTDPNGETYNTPAQVFHQMAIVKSLGLPCEITTDEPFMFNLETTISWTRADDNYKIVFNYHVLSEKTKGE